MIAEAGFSIIEEKPYLPTEEMLSILRKEPIHDHFKKRYSERDLAITGAWIFAIK